MGTFFPDTYLQTIIEMTDGVLVRYRGQEAYFHFENPTLDDRFGFNPEVQGLAKVLIGDATVFSNLEENTLIEVAGDDYLVGTWQTPEDGGVILIYLKTSLRV